MTRTAKLWLATALVVGLGTYFGLRHFGTGAVRADAPFLAGLVAALTLGVRHLRLKPRGPDPDALLTAKARRALLILLGLGAVAGGSFAATQALGGYRPLAPDALLSGEVTSGFVSATGKPLNQALYTMDGSEGARFAVPLDRFQGRLIILSRAPLPDAEVTITGKLRDDVRAVQRSQAGAMDGPFLTIYRQAMGLHPSAPVLFLDTDLRAGLNATALLAAGLPLFLFLLVFGAATKAPRPLATLTTQRAP